MPLGLTSSTLTLCEFSDPLFSMSVALTEKEQLRAEYFARWEAVETVKACELANMTEERALQIISRLRPFGPTPPDPSNGLGLVEQQAIFHRKK